MSNGFWDEKTMIICKKHANRKAGYKVLASKHHCRFIILPLCIPAVEQRLYRLRRTIKFHYKKMNRFFTLTLDNNNLMNSKNLSSYIRKFINRMKGYYKKHSSNKKKLDYIWKIEYGKKSGRIHVHMLTNFFIPKKKLEKWWKLGYVNAKFIRNQKMAKNYASKYFSKAEEKSNWAGGRSFGRSKGLKDPPKSDEYYCVLSDCDLETAFSICQRLTDEWLAENEIWVHLGLLDFSPDLIIS